MLSNYLSEAREREASDLHLSAGATPFLRVEGELERFDSGPLPVTEAEELAAEACRLAGVEPTLDSDFCIEHAEHGRFRVNLHRQIRGPSLSLKCIPSKIPTLEDLGLPDSLQELTFYRTGMVLVTGPANCGKSSTLAALLNGINQTRHEHAITIEDPIEYVFTSDKCNVTQRQVGPHTRSFGAALRAALREDPDIILLSELRDQETSRTAIVAAETGHLVLGTLHTRNAASTINRLLDVFPAAEQEQVRTMIAASLRTVISQRLLSRAGGGRRVPAYEILHVTPAVANLIRDDRAYQVTSQLQIGKKQGMVELDARLAEMLAQGLITRETALAHVKNEARLDHA